MGCCCFPSHPHTSTFTSHVGPSPAIPSPAINNPRSTRQPRGRRGTCLIYLLSSSGALGVLHGGDVTLWGCHLCPVIPHHRRRRQRRICLNTLGAAQELNMKSHSCSQSLILVTDKLPLTWNRVENKQRGKGHVNNSFPQNPASLLCYRNFPLCCSLP